MKMAEVAEKIKGIPQKFKAMPKSRLIKIGVIAAVAIAVVTIVAVNANKGKGGELAVNETDRVIRGDIEETITGSAVVEPYERYEIIALVSGDIISSPFEVGDEVKEGDLLYEFDKSTASLSIEKQELSLEQSRNSYNNALEEAEKLTVKAPCSGVISGIEIKEGKDVQGSATLATIENTYNLEVDLPFNYSQVSQIYVGDTATVSSSAHMSQITGTVKHVAANPTTQADGTMLYNVTISLTNPGALSAGLSVGGEIKGMISPGSGVLKNGDTEKVNAEVAGEVTRVYVENGDYVNKGDVLFTLKSDSVTNSIKNSDLQYRSSSLSLQETRDGLEDYSLTSPINGTVLTKNKKAGDTIDRNSSTQTLMVVADISKLKFVLSIDELDISKVEVGQEVKVTCDALEGEVYYGEITNVSVEGTSTNGVTVYEAEVVVAEPGNLRPSMNIDATVVFNSSENTLMVPSGDIKTVMGKSYVFVKSGDAKGKSENDDEEEMPVVGIERGENERGGMPEGEFGGERPDMPEGEFEDGEMPEMPEGGNDDRMKNMMPEAPEGYETVEVTVGISNDEYTEILSGLREGDEIYRMTTSSSSGNDFGMMGGMGAMGGGAPGGMGGMSGGPSGMGGGTPGGMGGGR